jgi:spectinomycin phosphotransferase/16S rRNA (guanine(1405)-N(7))-methyltransferase
VLAPPDDLPEPLLTSALARSWGLAVTAARYRPVGWGSHHWDVADPSGRRWFVTADDLEQKRLSDQDPLEARFARLRASLAAACDLRDCGRSFVVAPVLAGDGEPVARVGARFAVAVYPFVDGQAFEWGEFPTPEHRLAVLALLAAVHTAPAAARRHALADDFTLPQRGELEAACDPAREAPDRGPYARAASLLLRRHAAPVRRLLARYDELARRARAMPGRTVLTHGEPHPGNTMRTADGWVLMDWDTVLVAPPERDLWHLDRGDAFEAYARATGTSPLPWLLDLYRLRWDLTDLALYASDFRRPHARTADDDKSWELLNSLVRRVSRENSGHVPGQA